MAKESIYRGHPKADWPRIRAEHEAKRATQAAEIREMLDAIPAAPANAFGVNAPEGLPETAPPPVAPVPRINSEPDAPTPIPRNLFDGSLRKLVVLGRNGSTEDAVPGFRLYWFNDPGGTGIRIAQAKLSGWEHVTHDEVVMADDISGISDLGSAVSYVVNPNVTPPTRAYLMKKPKWLDEAHQAERERLHQRTEAAMRAGTLNARPDDKRYTAQPGSALPEIDISSKLYR